MASKFPTTYVRVASQTYVLQHINLDKWCCEVLMFFGSLLLPLHANILQQTCIQLSIGDIWRRTAGLCGPGPGLEAAGWDVAGAGQVWPGAGPHQSASCSLWLPSYPSTRQHSTTSE